MTKSLIGRSEALLCGQGFDSDLTTEAALDGTVDLSHPSRP